MHCKPTFQLTPALLTPLTQRPNDLCRQTPHGLRRVQEASSSNAILAPGEHRQASGKQTMQPASVPCKLEHALQGAARHTTIGSLRLVPGPVATERDMYGKHPVTRYQYRTAPIHPSNRDCLRTAPVPTVTVAPHEHCVAAYLHSSARRAPSA